MKKINILLLFFCILFVNNIEAFPPPSTDFIDNPEKIIQYQNGLRKYSRFVKLADNRLAPKYTSFNYPSALGNTKICVILLQFSNVSASPASTKQKIYDLIFNEETNSLAKYYKDVSYGKFRIVGTINDIHGWYTSSRTMEYYGADSAGGVDDLNTSINNMIKEAIDLAKANGVDFSQYDVDGNGVIDHLLVVHSGVDQANTSNNDAIWSHGWFVNGDSPSPYYPSGSAKGFSNYITISEFSPIGLVAHEFGHDIGLIDTYKTSSFGGQSVIGKWDLMDYGIWNNNGNTPAAPCVYHKIQLGWIIPTVITTSVNYYSLQNIYDADVAVKIPHPRAANPSLEYYLLSNRQKKGWDAYIPGEGLLVWHINDAQGSLTENDVQNYNPPRIRLVSQSNNTSFESNKGLSTDPWKNNLIGLTATSIPNNAAYNGQTHSKPIISNISNSGNFMSFHILSDGSAITENIYFDTTAYYYNNSLNLSWAVSDPNVSTEIRQYKIYIYYGLTADSLILYTTSTIAAKNVNINSSPMVLVKIEGYNENNYTIAYSNYKMFFDTSQITKTDFSANNITVIANSVIKTDTEDFTGAMLEYLCLDRAADTFIIFDVSEANTNLNVKLKMDNKEKYILAALKKKSKLSISALTNNSLLNNDQNILDGTIFDVSISNETGVIYFNFSEYFDSIALIYKFPNNVNVREYTLVYFDNANNVWKPIENEIVYGANYIKTHTNHLTYFAVRRATDYTASAQLVIYPNPWDIRRYRSLDGIYENTIKFCYQSSGNYYDFERGTILKIYDVSGKLIKQIIKTTNLGNPDTLTGSSVSLLSWDLTNQANVPVASGVYLVLIQTPNGKKFTGKCAVIK